VLAALRESLVRIGKQVDLQKGRFRPEANRFEAKCLRRSTTIQIDIKKKRRHHPDDVSKLYKYRGGYDSEGMFSAGADDAEAASFLTT
jgi:hypothetical protein